MNESLKIGISFDLGGKKSERNFLIFRVFWKGKKFKKYGGFLPIIKETKTGFLDFLAYAKNSAEFLDFENGLCR